LAGGFALGLWLAASAACDAVAVIPQAPPALGDDVGSTVLQRIAIQKRADGVARGQYSDEVKAAVMAALLAGQGVNEVAAAYSVPAATVRSWKSRAGLRESVAPIVSDDARSRISDLLVGYLAKIIGALSAQADLFADHEWLKKQTAGELAVLHGIAVDKAVRIFEAFEQAAERASADQSSEDGVDEVPEVAGLLPGAVLPGL
jgi:hypothetical protein